MFNRKVLLKNYFSEQSFISSSISSFNNFIDRGMQIILDENREIEPTIIPHNIDEFKIRLDKIWVTKPEITEADGSKRKVYPIEARLRKISYAAPVFLEVSSHINGVQRESFTTQICSLPIMLHAKNCHLNNLSRDELIKQGEDPDDIGGYFVVNGTEKIITNVEDLAANKFMIEKSATSTSEYTGKVFSERGSFKIPHTLEKMKDGIFYLSFTRVRRVPIIIIVKALGLTKDEDIVKFVSENENFDEVIVNLYEFLEIKTEEDAIDYVAKRIGLTQPKNIRIERMREILDKYLFPHLGIDAKDRMKKAVNICKLLKRYIHASSGKVELDDKDHYMNKRIKLSGDLLADLFRANLKVLIGDVLYNFQRIVKRGKFPSIKVVIRDKLLTERIYSSMATGNWVGGRKGISQRIQRLNYIETISHLQRVVSPLSTSQENFAARELHATHLGRLCPVETPEGTNIGLRKNLSLLASISEDSDEEAIMFALKNQGLKTVS